MKLGGAAVGGGQTALRRPGWTTGVKVVLFFIYFWVILFAFIYIFFLITLFLFFCFCSVFK